MTATSTSANDPVTSSASAVAACVTSDCVVNGVSVAASSAGPKGAESCAGVMSETISLLVTAGVGEDRACLVRGSQPRTSTFPT